MTYYEKEFSNLGDLPANMQITNELGNTKWLAVTPDQIKQILEILNKGATE